jgi:large subunit ribosomal protein L31
LDVSREGTQFDAHSFEAHSFEAHSFEAHGASAHGASRTQPRRPGDRQNQESDVKPEIHPEYVVTTVTCTCGNTFTTRSTAKNGVIHADLCSNCHPFYTGKQKILDTGGRVARFERRFGKKTAGSK